MPVSVQGPDGKTYQFPDGTDKTAAVAYFKKKGIQAAAPSQLAGFMKRFGEGVGLPTSKEELKAAQSTTAEIAGGPIIPAVKAGARYVGNLLKQGQNLSTELTDATKNVRAGQPVGPNVGKAASAATEFGLRGLLGPVGGEAVQTGGEDVAAGNYRGAAGGALATIVNGLMLKGAMGPNAETRINKLAYAGGKGAAEPIEVALKDLQQTIATTGEQPKTVGDFLKVVNQTKDRMNTEAGAAMLPIAGQDAVTTGISDRIRSLITDNMDMTSVGRRQKKIIQRAAAEFDQPGWTYRKLDRERMDARNRKRSFNNKNPVEQYSAKGANRNLAIDDAIDSAIRDTVYPEMDQAAGRPPGYFAALKGRQSQLIDLQSTLLDRVKDLRDVSARSKGAPRIGSENVSLYGHPGGGIGTSVHRLQDLVIRPDLEAAADKRVAQGFSSGSTVAKAGVAHLPIHYLLEVPQPDAKKGVASALSPQ